MILRRGGLLLLLLLATVVALAPAAGAHSDLVSVEPADGASLAAVPAAVTFSFNEEIEPTLVRTRVEWPDGDGVAVDATVSGAVVTVPVDDHGAGAYKVIYRVVSRDGHPVSGQMTFTVSGPASATAAATSSTASSSTAAPSTVSTVSTDDVSTQTSVGMGPGAILVGVVLIASLGAALFLITRRKPGGQGGKQP